MTARYRVLREETAFEFRGFDKPGLKVRRKGGKAVYDRVEYIRVNRIRLTRLVGQRHVCVTVGSDEILEVLQSITEE